jgi:cell division protein FtsQ
VSDHVKAERLSMLGKPRNRRRRDNDARTRWRLPEINWRRLFVSVTSVVAVCLAVAGVLWTLDQPIQRVSVSGRFQHVAPVDVERIVKEHVRGMGLLSVDLASVRHALHQIPWVDAVSIQRSWPRGLTVLVIEQVAAARWGDSGLLNTRGELFSTDEHRIPPELARLSGPQGKEAAVAEKYLAEQGRLTQAGLHMTAMRLDARGAWEFDLANGVTVRLGRRQVDERFDKFMIAALKLVTQRGDDISYIDMRYTNGFAIGWRGSATHKPDGDGGRDA